MANRKNTKALASESLLVELLTEELPPKSLMRLAEAFGSGLFKVLRERGFAGSQSELTIYATPRRLAALITQVVKRTADKPHTLRGPSVTQGFDSAGNPTQALAGWMNKNSLRLDQLVREKDPKGERFVYHTVTQGDILDHALDLELADLLRKLPVRKIMRWGEREAEFVRPVHGLVMMHGRHVIRGSVLGAVAGNTTQGHRFMGARVIRFAKADEYETKLLKDGKVYADFGARRTEIEKQLIAEAKKQKADLGEYQSLLDEVTALVECPSVYPGEFDNAYLGVPQECLVLTMQQNQKYFPLFERSGKLLPKFLIVSNMRVADPRHIVRGNERVVRPRLEDARFFYDQDKKTPLRDRVQGLAKVIYYRDRLGSQLDRVRRITSLAERIASTLLADASLVRRAAELSKADLQTRMVGEFPELQGVMGRYYALSDNEPTEVANAIEQHYRPRFAGDRLPEDLTACVLALADKLEAIAGMFGVGQEPTGDKDPYALRRQALGVVRILIEKKLEIGILPLVDLAIGEMPPNARSDWLVVIEFLLDRARSYFSEQGYASTAIEAVLQPFGRSSWLYTLPDTVAEASRFIATEEGKILAEANKRITNILKKSGYEVPFGLSPDELKEKPNSELFSDGAETEFWDALQKIGAASLALKRQQRFAESLRLLSQLGMPTKSFFDNVMVNVEDVDVRDNRITLLQHARAYMNQVADLTLMAS